MLLRRVGPISLYSLVIGKPLLAAILASALLAMLPRSLSVISLTASVGGYLLVYMVVVATLGLVRKEELAVVVSALKLKSNS